MPRIYASLFTPDLFPPTHRVFRYRLVGTGWSPIVAGCHASQASVCFIRSLFGQSRYKQRPGDTLNRARVAVLRPSWSQPARPVCSTPGARRRRSASRWRHTGQTGKLPIKLGNEPAHVGAAAEAPPCGSVQGQEALPSRAHTRAKRLAEQRSDLQGSFSPTPARCPTPLHSWIHEIIGRLM